jgi:hypothetical protein
MSDVVCGVIFDMTFRKERERMLCCRIVLLAVCCLILQVAGERWVWNVKVKSRSADQQTKRQQATKKFRQGGKLKVRRIIRTVLVS